MTIFDQARMRTYFAEKLGAEKLSITSVWKNLQGWSMETYSLGLSYVKEGQRVNRALIIRKQPAAGLYDWYDASREYRVLEALNRTEVAVPSTYWLETDPEILGHPFYVMERVEGYIPYPPPICFDPHFRLIPDDRERSSIAEDFVKNLALIHSADWRSLSLDFLGVPGPDKGAALQQVEYWEDTAARANIRKNPLVTYSVDWLKDNLVSCDRVSLVHSDYRSGNYIVRDGRIVAILDWEGVYLGDPLFDIAYVISGWRSAPPFSWVSHLLPEEEFFARYEVESGIKIDMEKLQFYRLFNRFRSLVVSLFAANSWKTRSNVDLRVGMFGMTFPVGYFDLANSFRNYISTENGA